MISRRELLLGTAAGTALAALPQRPNILWITCEDASPNLGCYGDSYARTPVLDGLAAEGVRYTNAYGVTGVCSPNRSCLITGVYPSTLGSQGMRSHTRLPRTVKCFPEYLRQAGYYCSNNVKTDYNFDTPPAAWDESSNDAHWRKRAAGQPFFSVFNIMVTHESQVRQPDESFLKNTARLTPEQRHDPAKAPIPPMHPDTPEVRRDWARYHDLVTAMDYQAGDVLRELAEDGLADSTIVFFFSDHGAGMPGYKKWVWEAGLRVPFIVRTPGQRPGVSDRMVSFVDFAPTVLSLAGVKIPAHMQGRAFLGAQEAASRTCVYATRDRMIERHDLSRVVRDQRHQYIRNYMPHRSWSQFISYTEEMPTMKVWRSMAEAGRLNAVQARYFAPAKPREELYDTAADPHQVRNLAGDPALEPVLRRMREESRRWSEETHDLGFLPEYEIERRSQGRTPYETAHDPKANPLKELAEAADLASQMSETNVPALVRLLGHGDPAVRYWGAVGLVALGEGAAPAAEALREALTDSAPGVRVEAAEALALCGGLEEALPVLIQALQHESALIRLRAINVLDRLGPKAKPALPAIRKAGMEGDGPIIDYLGRMVRYVPGRIGE